jgi:DNA-binding beta-propeller fold protein YncE
MRLMQRIVVGFLALAFVAACGPKPQESPIAGDYRLFVAASGAYGQQVAIIDSKTQKTIGSLPLGTPSPDWQYYYTAAGGALKVYDPQTGAVIRTLQLPRPYELPLATLGGIPGGLSPNGRWLVLETSNATTESHLLVVDTRLTNAPVAVDLVGSFAFDAINNDGTRLYLIQHADASHYFVRYYNVSARTLDPQIVFDKSDGGNAMTGTRLSGIPSRDGQWLFSVYARQDKSAFIHALNLENAIALCLDLPGGGYAKDPTALTWSLAMGAGGSRLYAVNGPMGIVTTVDTSSIGIIGTTRLTNTTPSAGIGVESVQAKEIGGGAAMSPDGQTLVMTNVTGIDWIDVLSLKARNSGLASLRISSLAISPDGSFIFALDDSGAISQVSIRGTVLGTFNPGIGQPLAILRVVPVP